MDYGQPRAVLPLLEQLAHDSLASRVEKAGEPFRLFFTPAEIAAELSRFHSLEDLGAAEINARYFRWTYRSTRDARHRRPSSQRVAIASGTECSRSCMKAGSHYRGLISTARRGIPSLIFEGLDRIQLRGARSG